MRKYLFVQIKHLYPSTSIISSYRTLQVLNFQSTTVSVKNKNKKPDTHSDHPVLDTRFNQYRIAYRYRRNIELLRGYLVYRLFSINFLVNNQAKVKLLKKINKNFFEKFDQIAKWGQRILGARLFNSVLKRTAFGHFVGGETPQEITPVIKKLQKYGVKPILDYSVESDDAGTSSSSYVFVYDNSFLIIDIFD